MKIHTEYLWFETRKHQEYLNITDKVAAVVKKSGVKDGMALVSAMHITAGVYVNDAEDGLIADIDEWLEHLAPFRSNYRHHRTGESNGDAHLKSLLVHHEIIVPVTKGLLDFGPWQQIYYAEFDGQRKKRVIVKVKGGVFGCGAVGFVVVDCKLVDRQSVRRLCFSHDWVLANTSREYLHCAESS